MSLDSVLRKRDNNADCLHLELLEDRILLANIVAVDAYLVDGSGATELSEAFIGQQVALRIDWQTINLPSNIPAYQVGFKLDGVELRSSAGTFGAGLAQGNYWWYQLGWYASPGQHTVEITVDVDNVVVEDDETDNTITFNFTPVAATSFPQKMIWPLSTAPQTEGFWTNYADVDPTSGLVDYQGGNATYNGHNAIDGGAVNFAGQDRGIDIYAAADGVVTFIREGEFDRQTSWTGAPSNLVIIDHGNGWETKYLHMRRDSVQVTVGQSVNQGDRIGLLGSSGNSSGPHIHFHVEYLDLAIETYYDPNTYWVNPVDYVYDNQYLIETGVTNYVPNSHFWELPSDIHTLKQQSGITLYARGYYSGLNAGDLLEFKWYRPSGALYTNVNFNVSQNYRSSGWWGGVNMPTSPDLGTWRVEYHINGALLGQEFFAVQSVGEPEIRLEDASGQVIIDGRYTPFDFGEAFLNSNEPTQTFTIVNHGFETLEIDSITMPTGFQLVQNPVSSLAPGASDTFTVALDTSIGGYRAGQVKLYSNDSDESIYNFTVDGTVTSDGPQILVLGIGALEVVEGDQQVANIRRTGPSLPAATVNLASSHSAEVTMPSTIQLAAGQEYAQFFISAVNDGQLEWTEEIEVTASASGYFNATNWFDVPGYAPVYETPGISLAAPVPPSHGDVALAIATSVWGTAFPGSGGDIGPPDQAPWIDVFFEEDQSRRTRQTDEPQLVSIRNFNRALAGAAASVEISEDKMDLDTRDLDWLFKSKDDNLKWSYRLLEL